MAIQSTLTNSNNLSILSSSLPMPQGRPWTVLTPCAQDLEQATMENFFDQLKVSAEQIRQCAEPIIQDSATKPLGEIIFSLFLVHLRLCDRSFDMTAFRCSRDNFRILYNYSGLNYKFHI